MSGINRLHGRTALQHDLCYHVFHDDSSSYGNSIFNTTYNFNGGMMCGGGFFGGMLGGFGMGLGAMFGNMLGGLFGGFGGFSGFGGFGGMFGGFGGFSPFGMFGGGGVSPFSSWFGGSRRADGAGGKDKETKTKDTDTQSKHKCEGKDAEYLHTLRDRLNKIDSGADKKAAIKSLYNDVQAVIKQQKDDEHNTIDENNYKDLLKDLKTKATALGLEENDGKLVDKEAASVSDNADNNGQVGASQGQAAVTVDNKTKAVKFTLNFAQHDRDNMIDKVISGDVIGIKTNANGKVENYVIKCTGEGNTLGLTYLVTPNKPDNPTSYNIKCISTKHKAINPKTGKPYTLYKKDNDIGYTLNNNSGILEYTGDETTVTTSKEGKTGYSDIEYDPNADEKLSDFTELQGYDSIDKYNVTTEENGTVTVTKKTETEEK